MFANELPISQVEFDYSGAKVSGHTLGYLSIAYARATHRNATSFEAVNALTFKLDHSMGADHPKIWNTELISISVV
jgi:hypothetical protein